jgi:hypothetical protein
MLGYRLDKNVLKIIKINERRNSRRRKAVAYREYGCSLFGSDRRAPTQGQAHSRPSVVVVGSYRLDYGDGDG